MGPQGPQGLWGVQWEKQAEDQPHRGHHQGKDPSESIIAIIYLQWVVFGMIFEELNPARHWLVLPVGIKGRSPKSIAGKIEQSDMSFRPINGFVSYSVLKKDIVFCPKCSGFGIPVQQNSLDNFLRVPIERKLTGNKVLVFAMLSPLRKVLGRDFKTEKQPILSHSGRRPGIQKQNTHWIPVFTGMTTVVSVLFVQM